MSDEESRKVFEEWARSEYLISERKGDQYFYSDTTAAFQGWQAALAWERERTKGLWALAKFGNAVLDNMEGLAMCAFAKHYGLYTDDLKSRTDLAKLPGELL